MTEKTETMEIHPMRGHSRGDWYCSLSDIASGEDEAEYWAIFGVTHRGNKHCLGEFPTKRAAEAAVLGWRSVRHQRRSAMTRHASERSRRQTQPLQQGQGKNVVQIQVVPDREDTSKVGVFALCENGTIWRRDAENGNESGTIVSEWEPVLTPGLEYLTPDEAFRYVIARSI